MDDIENEDKIEKINLKNKIEIKSYKYSYDKYIIDNLVMYL